MSDFTDTPRGREEEHAREETQSAAASPQVAATPSPADIAAKQDAADAAVLRERRKHTRGSLAVAALGAAAGWGLYRSIDNSPDFDMQPEPLRRAFQMNARLARAVFNDRALAPTYPLKRAEDLRVNGVYGLKQDLVPESWRLQLTGVANAKSYSQFASDVTAWEYRYANVNSGEDMGHDTKVAPKVAPNASSGVAPSADTAEKMAPGSMVAGEKIRQERAGRMPRGREEAGESLSTLAPGTPGLLLTLKDILQLPKHELVTQFKCIEGWSQIVHWGGVRMADLIAAYPPQPGPGGRWPRYVYMETPNGDYYVGYDLQLCLHPQTLLVTEMSGSPLTQFHGAPLRLHAPTKYGYKQIKRIGLIAYTDQRPDDYWTKLGYDWYAGL